MKVKYLVIEVSKGVLFTFPSETKPKGAKSVTFEELTMECLLTENFTKTQRWAVILPVPVEFTY